MVRHGQSAHNVRTERTVFAENRHYCSAVRRKPPSEKAAGALHEPRRPEQQYRKKGETRIRDALLDAFGDQGQGKIVGQAKIQGRFQDQGQVGQGTCQTSGSRPQGSAEPRPRTPRSLRRSVSAETGCKKISQGLVERQAEACRKKEEEAGKLEEGQAGKLKEGQATKAQAREPTQAVSSSDGGCPI